MPAYSFRWPGTTKSRLKLTDQLTSQFFYDISHNLSDLYVTKTVTEDRTDLNTAKTIVKQCVDSMNVNQMSAAATFDSNMYWFGSRKMHAKIERARYVGGTGDILFKDMHIPISFSINGPYQSGGGAYVDKFVTFHHSPSRKKSVMTVDGIQPTDTEVQNFLLSPDLISITVIVNPRGKTNLITSGTGSGTIVINASYRDTPTTPEPPSILNIGIGGSDAYYNKSDRAILHVPNGYNYYNEQVVGDDTLSGPVFNLSEYNRITDSDEQLAELMKVLSSTSSFFVSR